MEPAMEEMEAQLKRWSLKIDRLVGKTQRVGVQAGFDALIYVDELKALHAIAQSKFDEFRSVEERRRARMMIEIKNAWDDLDAAFRKPMPWGLAVKD